MGRRNHDGKRVKPRVLPLRAGTDMAERKIRAGVERIPEGAHLRKDNGCAQPGDVIQHRLHIRRKG